MTEAEAATKTAEVKESEKKENTAMETEVKTEATVKKSENKENTAMETDVKTEAAEAEDTKPNADVKTKAGEAEDTKAKADDEDTKKTTETNGDAQETAEASPLEKKIIRQIEYYFGDMNLARDKFLQAEIKTDDGWVTMETMFKFNRLRQLTEDVAVVAAALAKSTSGLMEVSEDKLKLRRSAEKPLPENNKERNQQLKQRSLYVKGFPAECALEDIIEFFDQHGGSEQVSMRRDHERAFKGSVFMIFSKVEDCKKFMETEDLKYKDTVLTKMLKDDYFKMKQDEKKQQREKEHEVQEESKKKREEEERKRQEERITTGAILRLTGLPEGCKMDEMKAAFGEWGTVNWVDYEKDENMAKVRFEGVDSAKDALTKAKELNDGKMKYNDTEIEGEVLEGDEEKEHWQDFFSQMRDRRERNFRGGRRGGGRGGGRGRGRGRGGKRSFGRDDGPSAKRSKDD